MALSDDVIGRLRGTYLQMSSDDTHSRKVTEIARQFLGADASAPSRLGHQLPHQQFQPLHIRRRDSRGSPRSRDQGQGRPMLRRTSEAALFPPIHAGRSKISTPVQGAGLTTSRSSTSMPLAHRDHAQRYHAHRDHTHRDQAPEETATPTPRREPSTHRQRLQGVSADVTKTAERRSKTEQGRRGSRHTADEGIPRLALRTEPPKTDRPAPRKGAPRSQAKGREVKEQFSIRRKIEQYRRWHEEQYLEKLKKLKQEVDQKFDDNRKLSTELQNVVEIDLQRIFQENGFDPSVLADVTDQEGLGEQEGVVGAEVVAMGEGLGDRPSARGLLVSRDSLLTAKQRSARELRRLLGNPRGGRTATANTWRTWRDVNDSDAYSDVHKYIRDNELMTPEKETRIREWICEVERACAAAEGAPTSISHVSGVSDLDSVFG